VRRVETDCSLECSQQPAAGPYTESREFHLQFSPVSPFYLLLDFSRGPFPMSSPLLLFLFLTSCSLIVWGRKHS